MKRSEMFTGASSIFAPVEESVARGGRGNFRQS